MRWTGTTAAATVAAGIAAISLGGCGSTADLLGSAGGGGVTGYTASNALIPVGYNSKEVDATHYMVSATGTAATPPSRLEKIATMRAAEIGKDLKLGFFKVEKTEPSVTCGKKVDGYKSQGGAQTDYAQVVLSVVYAPAPADATYQPTGPTFDRLGSELQTDVVPPEARASASQAVAAACGRKR